MAPQVMTAPGTCARTCAGTCDRPCDMPGSQAAGGSSAEPLAGHSDLKDTAHVKRLAVFLIVAGCTPDEQAFEGPGCKVFAEPRAFGSSSEFASATPGTLAGWNPDGRWFMVD